MFDWNGHFYEYVMKMKNGEENFEYLKETLNQNEWQNRIK